MPAQNLYSIKLVYKDTDESLPFFPRTGDTWQDAIHNWAEGILTSYQVVSATPSEDGRSGIMEIKDMEDDSQPIIKLIQATLIEDE